MTAPRLSAFVLLATAACAHGGAGGGTTQPPAPPGAFDFVPNGAQLILIADVGRIYDAPAGRRLVRLAMGGDRISVPGLQLSLEQIDRVVAARRFEGESAIVLADHHMDGVTVRQILEGAMAPSSATIVHERHGTAEVVRAGEWPLVGVIVHPKLFALMTEDRLRQFLADVDHPARRRLDPLASSLREAVAHPPTPSPPFVVSVAESPPSISDLTGSLVDVPPPLRIAAWAALDHGLMVEVHGEYSGHGEAEAARTRLDRLRQLEGAFGTLVEAFGLLPLMNGASVEVRGPEVALRLRLSESDLEGLLARAELLTED